MLHKQDESLDVLGNSAARLGQISLEISEELQVQNKMLDDMGNELERSQYQCGSETHSDRLPIGLKGVRPTPLA